MSKPNIFFIVIDSFRSDHFYGNKKTSLTPTLNNLSKNGVSFYNGITSADGTTLSLGSMFTSLYPYETGLGGNSFAKWDDNIENHISKLNGLGFDTIATIPKPIVSFGLVSNFNDFSHQYDVFYRLENGLGDEILEKLDSLSTKSSWFYYLHLLDLHQPVSVPDKLDNEKFGESQYARMISSIDGWLGKFMEKIDTKNTLIIITADHGDYLPYLRTKNSEISFEKISLHKTQGDFGNLFPGFMQSFKLKLAIRAQNLRKKQRIKKIANLDLTNYERRSLINSRSDPDCYLHDELIKIPILFSGLDFNQLAISNQVRNIDIFPTIFDILGLDNDLTLRGRSLLPFFKGENLDDLPCYIESAALVKKSDGDVIGIRTADYKYFRAINDKTQKVCLFNLKDDPLEEKNIAKDNDDVVLRMENILDDIRNNKSDLNTVDLDDKETKKVETELRKLGYI